MLFRSNRGAKAVTAPGATTDIRLATLTIASFA